MKVVISGYDVLLDEDNVQILVDYSWHAFKNRGKVYIRGWDRENRKKVFMHRLIKNAPKSHYVDHINHNTLDNRKSNLRLCKNSGNMSNRNAPSNNTSGYKGVSKCKATGKWKASIGKDNKRYYLGVFDTKEQAAREYNIHAIKLHGEFACLNNIVKDRGCNNAKS